MEHYKINQMIRKTLKIKCIDIWQEIGVSEQCFRNYERNHNSSKLMRYAVEAYLERRINALPDDSREKFICSLLIEQRDKEKS